MLLADQPARKRTSMALVAARSLQARPAYLTVPLILTGLAAGAGELSPLWAFGCAFAHGLLHLSSPLSPAIVGAGFVAARLAGRRGSWQAVLASVAGLAAAFAVRPDRAHYLQAAFLHNAGALRLMPGAPLPGLGGELGAQSGLSLLIDWGASLALLATALWMHRRARGRTAALPAGAETSPPSGPDGAALRLAATLLVPIFFLACLRSARFADYGVPTAALAAGLWWPLAGSRRLSKLVSAPLLAIGVALIYLDLNVAWLVGNSTAPPVTYEALAAAVRARVPAGTVLFTDDTFLTAVVYASLPEYRYIAMADPSLLYMRDARQFWIWQHAASEGTFCEQRSCDLQPSGEQVARAVRVFGAAWVVTTRPPSSSVLLRVMSGDPAHFELAAAESSEGTGEALTLWKVRVSP